MSIPKNRKLVAISTEAFTRLLLLREARARALGYRLVTLTDYTSELIMTQPVPNGNHPSVSPAPLPSSDDVPPSTPERSGGSAPLDGDQS